MDNSTKKERTTKANMMKRCFICSQKFERQNLDTHMHSYEHHKAIEQIKGSEQEHKCWACDVSVMGLHKYEEHIATQEHKHNLPELQRKRHQKERISVDYNIELNDAEFNTLRIQKQKGREERGLQICFVCCHNFPLQDLDRHMHSLIHHQAIEKLKGSEQVHKCWACDVSVTGLEQYQKHVCTRYHKKMIAILNKRTDDEKSTLEYSVQFDDELKALCAQRDQQITNKKNKQRLLRKEAKKAEARQNAEQKLIQNCQMNNKSQSVHLTTPALPVVDFTSDELPLSCRFSSWEEQQNLPTFRPNQKVPKRRREGMFDMENSNCPVVKRPCLSSERPAPEMSAQVSCPTPDGKVAGVCANELTSKNELVAFAESTSATEPVDDDDDDSHITTMLGTIRKSLDHRGVTVGSEVSVKSCTKKVVGQTYKSTHEEEQDERPKKSKNKHMKKKRPVKGKTSKQFMRIHSPEKSKQDPCSDDVTPALRSNKQNQMNAKINNKLQPEQDMPGEKINGREASVASLSSIERLDSQTSANCNENDCQILEFGGTLQPNNNHVTPEGPNHPCNLQKPKRKKQDISNITQQNPETNATFKQKNVKKLMTLSLREERLTSSLENVGDQLFQAYSTLQNAYTEVQHLLELKQQVTSEMTSLREKRIQILQELQNPSQTHTTSEHLT